MKNISGKRALITGASSGLGVEFAGLLAQRKVNLVLAARRQEPMEKLASQLRSKHGIEVLVVPIDLSLPDAASRLKGPSRRAFDLCRHPGQQRRVGPLWRLSRYAY